MLGICVEPSSLKTAKPVIGQPPSFKGASQLIVIEVVVVLTKLGGASWEGGTQVYITVISEINPNPLKFSA